MARHLLVTNDYPPKTGGIQVYLHELWRRLESDRAVVLTASSHPEAESFDANSEIVVERIPAKTLFFPTWRAKRAIESAIARHQPDLVLLDPVWPLGLLGPRLSVPYGVIVHGAEVTAPGRIPLVASSLRYVLKNAAVAICAGSYPESEVRRITAEKSWSGWSTNSAALIGKEAAAAGMGTPRCAAVSNIRRKSLFMRPTPNSGR